MTDVICIKRADQKYSSGGLMIIGTSVDLQNECVFIKILRAGNGYYFHHGMLQLAETSAQNDEICQKFWGGESVTGSYGSLFSLKGRCELKSSYFRFKLNIQPACYHDRLTF